MFVLRSASFQLNQAPFLSIGDLDIGPGVHAVVGPSGSGKSLLLHTLCDLELPGGVLLRGEWGFNTGRVPDLATRALIARSTVFFAQTPGRPAAPKETSDEARDLIEALRTRGATIWALDEPERSFTEADRSLLIEAIRRRPAPSIVLLVTHDVEFMRAISDYVHLIAGGSLMASCPTNEFFDAPPNDLAEQFIRTGNCSLPKKLPPLPSHFRWVIPGKLAGMGQPGLLRDAEEDLTSIALAGVQRLVSLTTRPQPVELLSSFGIEGSHAPIRDMAAPTEEAMAALCKDIWASIDAGACVAVHCRAGLGRTGLTLASLLIWRGATAADALAKVRSIERKYVQSEEQEYFLEDFERALRGGGGDDDDDG